MSATSQYNEGYKHMQETLVILYTNLTGKAFDFSRSTFYSLVVGLVEAGTPGIQLQIKDNASIEFARGSHCAISDFQEAVDMYKKNETAEVIYSTNIIF